MADKVKRKNTRNYTIVVTSNEPSEEAKAKFKSTLARILAEKYQ